MVLSSSDPFINHVYVITLRTARRRSQVIRLKCIRSSIVDNVQRKLHVDVDAHRWCTVRDIII